MNGFFNDEMNGDEWEKLCNDCYRLRYQEQGYQEIPASYKGDGGIEGFTGNGIVYQCYCPEKKYSDDELYEHMRDKMTKDINKFISISYEKTLKNLGIHDVNEWHFVVPSYKDKRILEHAEKKRKEVLDYRAKNLSQCSYISENFRIIVKVSDDFKPEMYKLCHNGLEKQFSIKKFIPNSIDWSLCESDKVNNIKRKIKAVMNISDDENQDYKDMVDLFVKSYIRGIKIKSNLHLNQEEVYEEIIDLETRYKNQVACKTKLNPDRSINYSLFTKILDEFEKEIKENISYLDASSIEEIKMDLISSWLADCSMQFR